MSSKKDPKNLMSGPGQAGRKSVGASSLSFPLPNGVTATLWLAELTVEDASIGALTAETGTFTTYLATNLIQPESGTEVAIDGTVTSSTDFVLDANGYRLSRTTQQFEGLTEAYEGLEIGDVGIVDSRDLSKSVGDIEWEEPTTDDVVALETDGRHIFSLSTAGDLTAYHRDDPSTVVTYALERFTGTPLTTIGSQLFTNGSHLSVAYIQGDGIIVEVFDIDTPAAPVWSYEDLDATDHGSVWMNHESVFAVSSGAVNQKLFRWPLSSAGTDPAPTYEITDVYLADVQAITGFGDLPLVYATPEKIGLIDPADGSEFGTPLDLLTEEGPFTASGSVGDPLFEGPVHSLKTDGRHIYFSAQIDASSSSTLIIAYDRTGLGSNTDAPIVFRSPALPGENRIAYDQNNFYITFQQAGSSFLFVYQKDTRRYSSMGDSNSITHVVADGEALFTAGEADVTGNVRRWYVGHEAAAFTRVDPTQDTGKFFYNQLDPVAYKTPFAFYQNELSARGLDVGLGGIHSSGHITSGPQAKISATGDLETESNLSVTGTATITGNATLQSDAAVTGLLTVGGNAEVTGTVTTDTIAANTGTTTTVNNDVGVTGDVTATGTATANVVAATEGQFATTYTDKVWHNDGPLLLEDSANAEIALSELTANLPVDFLDELAFQTIGKTVLVREGAGTAPIEFFDSFTSDAGASLYGRDVAVDGSYILSMSDDNDGTNAALYVAIRDRRTGTLRLVVTDEAGFTPANVGPAATEYACAMNGHYGAFAYESTSNSTRVLGFYYDDINNATFDLDVSLQVGLGPDAAIRVDLHIDGDHVYVAAGDGAGSNGGAFNIYTLGGVLFDSLTGDPVAVTSLHKVAVVAHSDSRVEGYRVGTSAATSIWSTVIPQPPIAKSITTDGSSVFVGCAAGANNLVKLSLEGEIIAQVTVEDDAGTGLAVNHVAATEKYLFCQEGADRLTVRDAQTLGLLYVFSGETDVTGLATDGVKLFASRLSPSGGAENIFVYDTIHKPRNFTKVSPASTFTRKFYNLVEPAE